MNPALAGIVLAGGAARRLGGVDKPLLEVAGRTLLDRAVTALREADPVVVVGPWREGVGGVSWTREDPPGSGPVAALVAGLRLVDAPLVAVLAADLRGVTADTVDRLRDALSRAGDSGGAAGAGESDEHGADGAVLVDETGRRQWLIGVWRTARLKAALPADPAGVSLRRTLGELSIVDVTALPGEATDVDTPEDLP